MTNKTKTGFPKKAAGITLLFLLVFFSFTKAQVAGTTSSVSNELSFSKEFNDVTLDPSPNIGSASRVEFLNTFSNTTSPAVSAANIIADIMGAEGIKIPDLLSSLISGTKFFCSGLEPSFNASASIDVGGYYQTHSIGKSKLAFDYPVKVDVVFPEKNTFGCGDKVTIRTSYTLLPSPNKMLVDAPFVNQEIGPILDNLSFNFGIGINAHIGYGIKTYYWCPEWDDWDKMCEGPEICGDIEDFNLTKNFSFDTNLPDLPPLINICDGAFGPDANESSLLSCAWSGATPLLQLGQWTLDTYNQQKNTSYTFATFPDHNTVEIAPPDLPSSSPLTIPEMEAAFKNVKNTELSYSTSNGGRNLHANGSKSSISNMSLDLVSLLDYFNFDTSYSFGDGKGEADFGDISPTFTVDQHMNFNYIPEIWLSVDLGVEMDYSVYNPDGSLSHSSFGRVVYLTAGQYIEATFPQYLSSPTTVSGSTEVKGNLQSKLTQEYYRSIQLKVGEVDIPGLIDLTLINETVQKQKIEEKTILEHTEEYSLGTANLVSFSLDPENPVIEIDYVKVEDEKSLGKGEKAVVYSLGIRNAGDVKLNDLQLNFDLGETYTGAGSFSVECSNSDVFELNTNYDGSSEINLLGANNMLDVGQTGRIEILVRVKPGLANLSSSGCFEPVIYHAKAKAFGVSPIGTFVENNYNHCTDVVTGQDIIASVDLGAEVISGIEDFTLYGTKLVKFDKPENYGLGNVGSGGNMVFENSSFQGADPTVIIGDIHIAGDLFLQGESKLEAEYIQLAGKLKNPNWKSKLLLNGVLSENSKCVATETIEVNEFTAGKSRTDIQVRKGKSEILAPGEYNAVTLFENSELILHPGTYRFGRWAFLGDNITVKFQTDGAPILINLNVWQALGRENTQLVIDGSGKAENVIFNYTGKQKCTFSASLVQGKIIAPNAEIEFTNNSVFEGKCYAEIINFKTGSTFRGVRFLEPLNIMPECQDVLIPGELPALKSVVINDQTDGFEDKRQNDSEIRVYPNPTNDIITITGLNLQRNQVLKILNSVGQVIELHKIKSNKISFNLGEYPSGVYYIEINNRKISPVVKL